MSKRTGEPGQKQDVPTHPVWCVEAGQANPEDHKDCLHREMPVHVGLAGYVGDAALTIVLPDYPTTGGEREFCPPAIELRFSDRELVQSFSREISANDARRLASALLHQAEQLDRIVAMSAMHQTHADSWLLGWRPGDDS